MGYSDDQLDHIFCRTDGTCHICGARLAWRNYARLGERGAWEVEHSNPRANGGTNRLNNLYAAHISCNRSKGTGSTRATRARYGRTAAPFSEAKREQHRERNAMIGAVLGGFGATLLRASGPAGIALVLIGGVLGHKLEPDPQRR